MSENMGERGGSRNLLRLVDLIMKKAAERRLYNMICKKAREIERRGWKEPKDIGRPPSPPKGSPPPRPDQSGIWLIEKDKKIEQLSD